MVALLLAQLQKMTIKIAFHGVKTCFQGVPPGDFASAHGLIK